jgi:protein-ribulosamine 3-kinase
VTLPNPVRHGVELALAERGAPATVVDATPLGGGCIHRGTRIDVDDGASYFVKWSPDVPAGMFEAEAEGLRALGGDDPVTVPEPVAWDEGSPAWLLMEYVAPGAEDIRGAALGRGLAAIHGSERSSGATASPSESARSRKLFGWPRDNWIGSLPQPNPVTPSWGAFWRDARLYPQLESARARGRLRDETFDRLLDAVPGALGSVTTPALIHGDLWSGNAYTASDGRPVLVDPAVYRGDGEVDLAMSELFGGFGRDFYRAYDAERPVTPEYRAFKRDLYQLYYLLVHVNLFGPSYEAGARRAAGGALAGLS